MTETIPESDYPILRRAGAALAQVLAAVRARLEPGVTARELDALAEEEILCRGARPAFKGYFGYPNATCISVDDEVVHGLPTARAFRTDDIVSVDCGLVLDGYFVDAAFTAGADGRRWPICEDTEAALAAGIAQARPGTRVGDIGAAVEAVARRNGLGVVRDYAGHGIGRALHQVPLVPNYGKRQTGPLLKPGTTLPMSWETSPPLWRRGRTRAHRWSTVIASPRRSRTCCMTPSSRTPSRGILDEPCRSA